MNHLVDFFNEFITYSRDSPLIFNGLQFWVFFALVLGIYSIIYRQKALRISFLFLVSLFFYFKTDGYFYTILLFSTLSDYSIGRLLFNRKKKSSKKILLILSICINLGVLVFFKYSYFFADIINDIFQTQFAPTNVFAKWTNEFAGSSFRVDQIFLPIGISFYTFQTISYVVDIYREKLEPVKNILDFGFYVSFFPQLVAGPIVRASEFIPQIYKPYKLTKRDFGMAIFWILNGLIKKLYLADYIAVNFVDRVFEDPGRYSGFENLFAMYGYSIQVYADFSGYTDMAIGLALLLGFRLPKNFNSPYKAVNLGDFWKRWHISLSTWLKDYLYIPLGGNRKASLGSIVLMVLVFALISLMAKDWILFLVLLGSMILLSLLSIYSSQLKNWLSTNVNIMLTMIIGGLWHGSSWNFVIWGALNGLGIVVYKLWRSKSPWEVKNTWYKKFIAIFITFNFITFTRIWFRSGSNNSWDNLNEKHDILSEFYKANDVLDRIVNNFDLSIIPDFFIGFWKVISVIIIGYIIHWLPSSIKLWYREIFIRTHWLVKAIISFITVFIAYQIISSDSQPFIYFQF